ncbi:MAG: TM0106 family RecB-like putative nuclease, partial [Candidatus Woesearchaeota archaeon]
AEQTVDLMKKGEKLIYQGVLIDDNLIGIPDFLEKKKGKSKLGNYYYQPIDIKSGLSAKEQYAMQVCFYCYLLEKIQGYLPEKFKLWLGNGEIRELETKAYAEKFNHVLEKIKEITKGNEQEVHICGECKECPWRNLCFAVAEKKGDLSLIFNTSRSNLEQLKENGIKTLQAVSDMDIDKLLDVKGFGRASLEKWKLQAKSLLTKKPIKISDYEFPKAENIYFDVEDTQAGKEKIVYLFGMVINGKYQYFLAENPSEEKKAWKEFLESFKGKENFKIYVYSGHEKAMLRKLFGKYGGDKSVYENIMNNLVDLLAVVKKTTIFPIYSYGIKDVAKFLGFKWTSDKASGGQSMIWYDKWLETGNKKFLKEVLKYNEEDCLAEVVIKDYIETNK